MVAGFAGQRLVQHRVKRLLGLELLLLPLVAHVLVIEPHGGGEVSETGVMLVGMVLLPEDAFGLKFAKLAQGGLHG